MRTRQLELDVDKLQAIVNSVASHVAINLNNRRINYERVASERVVAILCIIFKLILRH